VGHSSGGRKPQSMPGLRPGPWAWRTPAANAAGVDPEGDPGGARGRVGSGGFRGAGLGPVGELVLPGVVRGRDKGERAIRIDRHGPMLPGTPRQGPFNGGRGGRGGGWVTARRGEVEGQRAVQERSNKRGDTPLQPGPNSWAKPLA
jgi:hypothetical protein